MYSLVHIGRIMHVRIDGALLLYTPTKQFSPVLLKLIYVLGFSSNQLFLTKIRKKIKKYRKNIFSFFLFSEFFFRKINWKKVIF
jgi:hypothetical protein